MDDERAPRDADVSIEYAHIYADTRCGREQIDTAREALTIIDRLSGSWHAVVLVDQYNVPDLGFDVAGFAEDLSAAGLKPNAVYFEGDLVGVAETLLSEIRKAGL